jgi:cell division septal protein FtsQ
MYERNYHKKVLQQKAPPEKKRRKRFPVQKALLITVSVLIVTAIIVIVRLPQLQVTTVDVEGTSVVDPEDVSLFIKTKMEGNYLYIFPKTSMLLVPTATITKWTARQFPRFSTVDVRRKGVHGLVVTVTEHQGVYLWCDTEGVEDPGCFFMNKEGSVFAPAPFFSGNAYPKIYMGEKQELPFTPLTPAQLQMVQLFLERLPLIGIAPAEFRAMSDRDMSIIFSHNGSDAALIIDPTADTNQTLENLATALNTDPLKSEFKNKAKILEYLDARFSNKIVYKFR